MSCETTRYEVKRGTKRTLNATFDVSNLPSGSLSGVLVEWFVRRTKTEPSYQLYKTSASGSQIQVTNAPAGVIEIYLTPSDTIGMSPGAYYWTFRLYSDPLGLDEITPDNANGDMIILDSAVY